MAEDAHVDDIEVDGYVEDDDHHSEAPSVANSRSTFPSESLLKTTQARISDIKQREANKDAIKPEDDIWWEKRNHNDYKKYANKQLANVPSKLTEPTAAFIASNTVKAKVHAKGEIIEEPKPEPRKPTKKIDETSPLLKHTSAVDRQSIKSEKPVSPVKPLALPGLRSGPKEVHSKFKTEDPRVERSKKEQAEKIRLQEEENARRAAAPKVSRSEIGERLLTPNESMKAHARTKVTKEADPREVGWDQRGLSHKYSIPRVEDLGKDTIEGAGTGSPTVGISVAPNGSVAKARRESLSPEKTRTNGEPGSEKKSKKGPIEVRVTAKQAAANAVKAQQREQKRQEEESEKLAQERMTPTTNESEKTTPGSVRRGSYFGLYSGGKASTRQGSPEKQEVTPTSSAIKTKSANNTPFADGPAPSPPKSTSAKRGSYFGLYPSKKDGETTPASKESPKAAAATSPSKTSPGKQTSQKRGSYFGLYPGGKGAPEGEGEENGDEKEQDVNAGVVPPPAPVPAPAAKSSAASMLFGSAGDSSNNNDDEEVNNLAADVDVMTTDNTRESMESNTDTANGDEDAAEAAEGGDTVGDVAAGGKKKKKKNKNKRPSAVVRDALAAGDDEDLKDEEVDTRSSWTAGPSAEDN